MKRSEFVPDLHAIRSTLELLGIVALIALALAYARQRRNLRAVIDREIARGDRQMRRAQRA